MSTKNTATKSTTTKLYVLIDGDDNLITYGTQNVVEEALHKYNDGWDDDEFAEWVDGCKLYELGVMKKIKYTPAQFEIK
jgi:hypothetical protein